MEWSKAMELKTVTLLNFNQLISKITHIDPSDPRISLQLPVKALDELLSSKLNTLPRSKIFLMPRLTLYFPKLVAFFLIIENCFLNKFLMKYLTIFK